MRMNRPLERDCKCGRQRNSCIVAKTKLLPALHCLVLRQQNLDWLFRKENWNWWWIIGLTFQTLFISFEQNPIFQAVTFPEFTRRVYRTNTSGSVDFFVAKYLLLRVLLHSVCRCWVWKLRRADPPAGLVFTLEMRQFKMLRHQQGMKSFQNSRH